LFGVVLAVLLLTPLGLSAQTETIPLARDVPVYRAMSATATPVATLARGAVVTVVERSPGWMLVRYGDGRQGYLKVDEVLGAQPPSTRAGVDPCADPLYQQLRKKDLNAMTEREWTFFQERDRACLEHQLKTQEQTPAARTPMTPAPKPEAASPTPEPQKEQPQPAPPPQTTYRLRSGFWFNGGLGFGSLGCIDCTERVNGASGGLAVGGTLSQHVLLAIATNGWTKTEDGVTLSAGSVTGAIRFYPWSRGNFFVLGGVGVGQVDLSTGGFTVGSDLAYAALLGLGYDIRITPMTSVTPFWNGIGLRNDGGDLNWGQVGLGITIH
jgi:hypothetical protein